MRIIAHLDLDAFFASVEERDRPYLKGAPIVIGADPQGGFGRGVVSTANYAARVYGIHSATPIRTAWALSETARKKSLPSVIFISSGMKKYTDVSKRIMRIVLSHLKETRKNLFEGALPALEQVSVDECYFDLSFAGTFEMARKVVLEIKRDVFKQEKLTCSVGIGPNKLIAKIASDFKKPNGLTVVPSEQVRDFLEPLSVRKIPGIGPKAEEKFNRLQVDTVASARKMSEQELRVLFGKWGSGLFNKFRGEDDTLVITEATVAKSIGVQETFTEDTLKMKVLLSHLEDEVKEVFLRMRKDGFTDFRTIVLTVRFADFETVSRSRTLQEPVSDAEILRRNVIQMFFPFLDRRENPKRKKIRLVGIRVEKLRRS